MAGLDYMDQGVQWGKSEVKPLARFLPIVGPMNMVKMTTTNLTKPYVVIRPGRRWIMSQFVDFVASMTGKMGLETMHNFRKLLLQSIQVQGSKLIDQRSVGDF